MKLHEPFKISARLMPALRVGDAWISVELTGDFTSEGRAVYRYFIDLDNGSEYHAKDLYSGCGGGTLVEGFSSLLSFLGAAGESYGYSLHSGNSGETSDLFSDAIAQWAYQNSDELSMLQYEIEESGVELITN